MKLLLSAIIILSVICGTGSAHEQTTTVVIPLIKQVEKKGAISVGEADELIDPGYPVNPRGTLHSRCSEKQLTLLEECPEQDTACISKYTERSELCLEIEETQTTAEQALGIIPCNGIVPLQSCTVASPCVLGGDRNGDNVVDACNAGARCNPLSEGAVCDPGPVYDCTLVTTFYPAGPLSSFDRCECNCE